jgi:hypothetical protein
MPRKPHVPEQDGEGDSRREFLKKAALIGAAVSVNLNSILQARAQGAGEKALIDRAANAVAANAARGLRGTSISVAAQYRTIGGRNAEVIRAMELVDGTLARQQVFTNPFDPVVIDRGIANGIAEFARGNIGMVAGKDSQAQLPDSAARAMFERGGQPLATVLQQQNIQIRNLRQIQQTKPPLTLQPLTPQLTPIAPLGPGPLGPVR